MSKKKKPTKKEREAKHKAARRHPKNDNTPEVIPMSDQAAADPTINTQSAGDLVVTDTPVPAPEVSYDLSGKGDDLVDDTQDTDQPTPPSKKSEELAQEMLDQMQPEDVDDITFEVNFAEFTEKLKKIPNFCFRQLKAANDATVNGWQYLTDKVIGPAIDKFYLWCHNTKKAIAAKMPQLVTVPQMKQLTATLADVFAEVTNENRISNAEVLTEVAELKRQIILLTKAVNGKHPMTIPAESLNELFFMVRSGNKAKAATRYMQLTGSTLAVAQEFVGSVSVA